MAQLADLGLNVGKLEQNEEVVSQPHATKKKRLSTKFGHNRLFHRQRTIRWKNKGHPIGDFHDGVI